MSVTRSQTTTMNDQSVLAEALKNMGYKPEVLKESKSIRGHGSEMSRQKCNVVLRKEDTGRHADIGFSQAGTSGNFDLVTDTWVNRDIKMEEFAGKIKVEYSKVQAKKIARQVGATFMGETVKNGKVVLRFAKA